MVSFLIVFHHRPPQKRETCCIIYAVDFMGRKSGFRDPITAIAQTQHHGQACISRRAYYCQSDESRPARGGEAVVEGAEFGRDLWTQGGGARPFTRRRGSFLTDRRVSSGVLEGKRSGACLV